MLESPWAVIAGLTAAGVIALVVMQRRDRLKDGLRVLAVSVALAIGVLVLAASVTTEREVLAARTREAAIAAAGARVTDLRDLLTERASVKAFAGLPMPHGKEELLRTVQSTLGGTIVIKDLKIGPVRAIVDGPNVARTQVRVWATPAGEQAMYNAPTGAWFRLGWTREGDGPWRITTINVMQIDGLGVSPNPND
jgi:hypothetical protein